MSAWHPFDMGTAVIPCGVAEQPVPIGALPKPSGPGTGPSSASGSCAKRLDLLCLDKRDTDGEVNFHAQDLTP